MNDMTLPSWQDKSVFQCNCLGNRRWAA